MCNGGIDRLLGKVFFVKWVQILESMCNKQFEVDKETPGFIVECLFAKQACRMSSKKALFATKKEKNSMMVLHVSLFVVLSFDSK